MILQELLRRIKFKVGTTDDISGRAINPIVSNRNIIDELNSQLRQYANITKGIQDIYSFSLSRNQVYIAAPSLALRSEAYFHVHVIVDGAIFPIDMRGSKTVYRNFITNPQYGIPNWLMPFNEGFNQFFGIYPQNSNNALTATLTSDIDKDDTTIAVDSTDGFISNDGRFTIGNEKIKYQYKDTTNFYNCSRGIEMTDPASHSTSDTLTENNLIIFYSRLHTPIIVNDDDLITQEVLATEMEVCEEHLEGIIKAVAYNLIIKLDNDRAIPYKIDYTTLYEQYKDDIEKNYYRGRSGTGVQNPSGLNEAGIPYGTNWRY